MKICPMCQTKMYLYYFGANWYWRCDVCGFDTRKIIYKCSNRIEPYKGEEE